MRIVDPTETFEAGFANGRIESRYAAKPTEGRAACPGEAYGLASSKRANSPRPACTPEFPSDPYRSRR